MIIVKLVGGLGNQLFQYAFGRALAEKFQTELKLDTTDLQYSKNRDYALSPFRIKESFASLEEIKAMGFRRRSLISKLMIKLRQRVKIGKSGYYKEKRYEFDPEDLDLSDHCYVDGFWQSEKYFIDIEDTIRKEYRFKSLPDRENQKLLDDIQANDSVSLHIRRGDYITHQDVNRVFGVCTDSYYQSAISEMNRRLKSPHYYVFSDDIPWVQKAFKIESDHTIVTINNSNAHEDLRLMIHCKHNIVANSSFSWWGGWLNPNPDKTVIAPSPWFQTKRNESDLIPDGWLILRRSERLSGV